jgi:hypothetical protein
MTPASYTAELVDAVALIAQGLNDKIVSSQATAESAFLANLDVVAQQSIVQSVQMNHDIAKTKFAEDTKALADAFTAIKDVVLSSCSLANRSKMTMAQRCELVKSTQAAICQGHTDSLESSTATLKSALKANRDIARAKRDIGQANNDTASSILPIARSCIDIYASSLVEDSEQYATMVAAINDILVLVCLTGNES